MKNAQFWLRSRKAKTLTTGIYLIFRGLKFEPDAEIGQKGAFCKGLDSLNIKDLNCISKHYRKTVGLIVETRRKDIDIDGILEEIFYPNTERPGFLQ